MLELEHIQKAFDGVPVLKDLSLQVEDGEIVSILGPSGCGKTTLLNIILGIVDADQGEIRYSGEDLTRTPMEKRGFNIVFQDYALFPNLNVQQNITYGLRNKPGISSREEVDELIDLLGLREHLGKRIDQLSGGTGEEAGGYKKADGASDLNFVIVHKPAVIQYHKHAAPKIVTPDANQDGDAYKYGYRLVSIADLYANKLAGVYASYKPVAGG